MYQKLIYLTLPTILALGFHPQLAAEDTEIYFNTANPSGVAPNVLLILDLSRSMRRRVGTTTRIAILNEVLADLLPALPASLNVGLFRMNGGPPFRTNATFNLGLRGDTGVARCSGRGGSDANRYTQLIAAGAEEHIINPQAANTPIPAHHQNVCYIPTGGAVVYPVTRLDAPARSANRVVAQINSSANDVQQVRLSSTINAAGDTLHFGARHCSTTTTLNTDISAAVDNANGVGTGQADLGAGRWAGFRFGLRLPSNAIITKAEMNFTSDSISDGTIEIPIYGNGNDAASVDFGSGRHTTIGNRASTSASVDWDVPTLTSGESIQTPDLAPIIREIVSRADWTGDASTVDHLTILFSPGTNSGILRSFTARTAGNNTDVPRLTVEYCTSSSNNQRNVVGLRFENILVPQGAGITEAYLEFTAANPVLNSNVIFASDLDTTGIDGSQSRMRIRVHDHADSPAFTNENLLSRANGRTTRVSESSTTPWDWQENIVYQTSVRRLIRQVVDRPDWCGGNAMTFIIDSEDDDFSRRALSWDDEPSVAPRLFIEYRERYDPVWSSSDTYAAEDRFRVGEGSSARFYEVSASASPAQVAAINALNAAPSTPLPAGLSSVASPDTGCIRLTTNIPINSGLDDAESRTAGGINTTNTNNNEIALGLGINNFVGGLRFVLPLPPSASIMNARLRLTKNIAGAGPVPVTVNAEAGVNPAQFNTAIAGRTYIAGAGIPVNRTQPAVSHNTAFEIEVTPLVEAVLGQSSWTANNPIAFFLSSTSTNNLRFHSYEGAINTGTNIVPRLIVEHEERRNTTAGGRPTTARDDLLRINENLSVESNLMNWTPTVETLYEAALYWRGKNVDFGKQRGSARVNGDNPSLPIRRLTGVNPDTYAASDVNLRLDADAHRLLTSHPGSYSGGTYVDALNASDCQFSYRPACALDKIDGTPTYISPISQNGGLPCTKNYQILLTDGEPTRMNDSTETKITTEFAGISSCSTALTYNPKGDDGRCAIEMAKDLYENDQNPTLAGDQIVVTHTVAFNLNDVEGTSWLEKIAEAGGGEHKSASTAQELTNVLVSLTNTASTNQATFASPSIAVNTYNRLFSRDEIYFGIFEPRLGPRWHGNLKKYKICDDPTMGTPNDTSDDCTLGDVLDANDNEAVVDDALSADNGRFKSTATSVWSSSADGHETTEGGSGAEAFPTGGRTVYTDLRISGQTFPRITEALPRGTAFDSTSYPGHVLTGTTSINDLSHYEFFIKLCTDDDTLLTFFGLSVAQRLECEEAINWFLGIDVDDEDEDNNTTENRWWFTDVLHSSPNVVSYGQDSNGNFIDKVLVGTNDGGLHFVNGFNGQEEWMFVPNVALGNQRSLRENPEAAPHLYGLDTTPVLWRQDSNNDGDLTDTNDKIYVYIGQRRGGSNLYALDVSGAPTSRTATNSIVPKFLWRISNSNTDFTRLGQFWSEPVVARIRTASGPLDVLIFGGGYDNRLEATERGGLGFFGSAAGFPHAGNAIYVVNAETGERIFWIGHAASTTPSVAASGADIEMPNMYYSIASQLTVFDSDGDGFDDRIYVGDVVGQVWRVDLGPNVAPGGIFPEGSTVVGRLANISSAHDGTGTVSEQRRIFYRPAVSQVRDTEYSSATGGEYDYIVFGTGNRAGPLNPTVSNRLYAIRDTQVDRMQDTAVPLGIADDYPQAINSTAMARNGAPITNADLVSVDSSTLDSGNTAHLDSLGWYLDFDAAAGTNGEKILASPRVFAGTVIATSYVPPAPSANQCVPAEGSGAIYNLNLLSGNAALNWDGDTNVDLDDRRQSLAASGIPSEVVPVYTPEGVTVLAGKENIGSVGDVNQVIRTYWYQEL